MPLAGAGVVGLAAVVAIHELAEVVVIANGVRAGRSAAFAGGEPWDVSAPTADAGACQDECCTPTTAIALGPRP